MKKVVILWLFIIMTFMLLQAPKVSAYTKTKVTVTAGGNEIIRAEVARALTSVLQEANKIAEKSGDAKNVQTYFTPGAFEIFQAMVGNTGFFSTNPDISVKILLTGAGQYEVRGIKVKVDMGETKGDDVQELVFLFNFRLFIENIQFAMEEHHYTRLLQEGKKLDDMVFRQQVLSFIEDFRTAHNRKDITYLENAYSDDALIIVGRVLEKDEGMGDFLEASTLGAKKIEFIKLSKKQYVDRLRSVFQNNSFVRVIFDEVEIIRHSKYSEIYGVKLRQRWNSSNYSDEGYLFVMIDFNDPKKPVIHVRSWQPEPFEDGSVVGMGDFEIIE